MATTTTKNEAPSAELVLAARFKREVQKSARRTYNRAVREFMRDAECTEESAKQWLASIGVTEPTNGNGK